MKFVRYGAQGAEQVGLLDKQGSIRQLPTELAHLVDLPLAAADLERVRQLDVEALEKVSGNPRLGAVVNRVPNIFAIGLNYAPHVEEAKLQLPSEPMLFNKATSCLAGANDDIVMWPGSAALDWEVELGVVIGKAAFQVSEAQALEHVAGYCIVNDVSERNWQLNRGGQWGKGKSAPGYGPIGPWLVTPDEIADPQDLQVELRVNGAVMQSASTAEMIFGVAFLIAHLSQFMRLEPGDVISTGTPSGVGVARTPPVFLNVGDVVELSISHLGQQRQCVVAPA
ncbi:MAG: fumarylacetoacetate hydrolase family protein [Pseudomonas sp.]